MKYLGIAASSRLILCALLLGPLVLSTLYSPESQAKQHDEHIIFGVHSKTPPLEWRNNGVDQGFHLELMRRIGQLTNKQIVVRRKTFQQLLTDVHDDTCPIDVIAVVSPVTIDRQLSQSDPIYATHAKAYTLQGKAFIHGWHDLAGKKVAIKKGAFVDVYITGQTQEFERVNVDLYETGFQRLIAGEVDVVIAENFVARRLLPHYPSIRSSSDPLIYGAFNFVSNLENAQLMGKINDALRQLKLSGEYDRLINKWFGTGREKVDLSNTQQKMFWLAIIVSIISAIGMLFTGFVSLSLKKRTRALNLELAQRKRAEHQISNLSKQFQSVLDGIPHGVTLLNRECERLWSNDNNNELLTSSEFLFLNGDSFTLSNSLTQVLDSQNSLIADMIYRAQFWQLQIHFIGDDQAVILLEEATEQHNLRQANDEASRLASLGELSAGIAHEINNPTGIIIHSIAFFNDALKDLQLAANSYQKQNPFWLVAGLEPQHALVELNQSSITIEEGANRISRIVNDLKRYALPNITNEHQAIELNEVVNVSLRLTANQTKIFKFNIQLSEPSPVILGDAQQLHQVMINLIQNACHACNPTAADDEARNIISIETGICDDKVFIIVSDTGSGMDSATLQRITEPFFTTRRSCGGSGLGLSVCSRIIKEHQAEMQFSSRLDHGTSIKIVFSSAPVFPTSQPLEQYL